MSNDSSKVAVGKAAADLVQDGMCIGLGTGSTAKYLIDSLIERCQQGLKITAVATSNRSREQAEKGRIPMIDINTITQLDMVLDGADEVDSKKRLIKGGGGALLREKIVANMSKEMVVIVDESKPVEKLGAFPLPVEIIPFASRATISQINEMEYHGELRQENDQSPYITDGGHYIYDIHCTGFWDDPEKTHLQLIQIPGVVETGFFLGLAGRVLIGYADGRVEQKNSF